MTRMDTQITVQPFGRNFDLDLCFFGKENCLPSHSWGPGVRDQYIFHYIHSGKGILKIAEKTYALTEGQGFLICPNTIVFYKADEMQPWTYSWLGFQGLQAKACLERANMSMSQPVYDAAANAWFETFFEQLTNAHRTTRTNDLEFQSILYHFFVELIKSTTEISPSLKPANTKQMYLKKAIDCIEINFSQKLSVLDIARVVGLNQTYLSSLFKENYNISLQTFLLQYRMNRACELMLNSELTIGDISRSVGYPDPFLFSKMFKKTKNTSPRRFREIQHKE
jgi:AraC family transcriptional regulator of arabinose operon